MTLRNQPGRRVAARPARMRRGAAAWAAALVLAGCGGGNPLDNPPLVNNPAGLTGQKLSFAYFQRCINPIFLAVLPINVGGVISNNTCAGSGCHADATGTGGAFRVVPTAATLDLSDPANTPAVIRASDMYRNYYSAQGEVVFGSPTQSRLLAKPMLINVLHGGGLIFDDVTDTNVRLIQFWMSRPMSDEFSNADDMFTPANQNTGACRTQ